MSRNKITPWLFVGPAVLFLIFFLFYPSINTLYLSFFGPNSEKFVGVQNYLWMFTSSAGLTALRNNGLWIGIFTTMTVGFGLSLAVLLDRVPYEKIVKSIVFMPMAISFVGASIIWKFVYAYRPPNAAQIGFLNAILKALGGNPIAVLIQRPWLNNFALIIVGVWIWTGYCMVVLSAAYKDVPQELIESARIDGANEWQVFLHVTFPLLRSTIAVVATTIIVFVLKIFDIIYVMTNGQFGTEILANLMVKQMFSFNNYGKASTAAMVLLLLVIPLMVINIRRFRRQREIR
ncbi:MAG: carbohydrate ABC transporter permease [Candidatus Bipolaricaulota bacterium]